jgi:hypothetical protein
MKQRTRIYYSESQKALMWDRWDAAISFVSISKGHSVLVRLSGYTCHVESEFLHITLRKR